MMRTFPCNCCECRGVMCMMYHEGHSHKFDFETCPLCEGREYIDARIFHENGHVWPGYAGEPDDGYFGGGDF